MKKAMFVLALTVWTAFAAFAQNGVIKDMTGTVELKPAGAAGFTAAKAGDEIAPNTIVSTGFKSTAVITVGSATIVARPLTRLTLTEIAKIQETETINVSLQAGRVRVDVTPPSGTKADFKVTSPIATASVRGTSFSMDTRNLEVTNGTVLLGPTPPPAVTGASGEESAAAAGDGGAIPVRAGFSSMVNASTSRTVNPVEVVVSELVPPAPVAGPPSLDSGVSSSPNAATSSGGGAAVTPEYSFTITITP